MKAKFYTLFLLAALSFGFVAESSAQLIMTQPRNVNECATTTATITFSVTVYKIVINPIYQWQAYNPKTRIWTDIDPAILTIASGTTTRTLTLSFSKFTLPLTTDFNNSSFRCKVLSGKTTEYSNAAILYVNTIPSIYSQPSGATKNVGESVTFSVGASNASSYQWRKDGADIEGATSSVLSLSSLIIDDAGDYSCRVTNSCGYRTSSTANLTVNAPVYDDGWFKQTSATDNDLKRVDAIDEYNAASIATTTNTIQITSDGGESWSSFPAATGTTWYSLAYPKENNIVVGGYNVINTTIDGGNNWKYYYFKDSVGLSSANNYLLNDIYFIDGNTGYACGYFGLIIKTSDGGLTWQLKHSSTSPNAQTDAYLNDIFFISEQVGWAVGNNGVILKTENGGTDWIKVIKSNNLNGVSFINQDTGYIVGGAYRYILKTTNGGISWNELPTASMPYFLPYSITCTAPGTVYAVGYKYISSASYGVIAKSIDGGQTWYEQVTDDIKALKDIVFVDKDNAWAVGDDGEIQRTAYGGCLTPSVDLGADQAFCASGSALLNAGAGNSNCFYEWSTGSTAAQISASTTGSYWVNVTNLCGVMTNDTVNLNVFPLPIADAGEDVSICFGDTIQLMASGGNNYSWITGTAYLSEDNIQNPLAFPPNNTSTTFTVEVTDDNHCSATDNVKVNIRQPYEGEKICIVTIDQESGKNMIVWDKTPDVNIASYNIYRLGTGGVYNLLGNVSVNDLSVFVDATSDPESTQYLYKLSAVDNCGNESAKSHFHKTLFLQYSNSVGGVNLFWQDYEIENESVEFSDFEIYRGSDSTALTKINTVSGTTVFKDTDPVALTQKFYYRVAGVLPEACDPENIGGKKVTSGPYVHSLSNLEDNRLNSSGVSDYLTRTYNVQVYPNPFKEETGISYRLPSNTLVKLEVYNILGERVAQIFEKNQFAGDYKQIITATDLKYQNGLYYIRLSFDGNQLTRKIMLTK